MATNIDAGIIEQRVLALETRQRSELVKRLGPSSTGDVHKRKSAAFVTLCASLLLELEESDALDTLTDGGDDCGIDALHIGDVQDLEFEVFLFQAKYSKDLDARSGFSANSIGRIIETIRTVFDPSQVLSARPTLLVGLNEIRGLIIDGNIPRTRVYMCNNGKRWEADGEARIDAASLGERVTFAYANHATLVSILGRKSPVNATLRTIGKAIQENFNHRRAFIGRVPVKEIARIFDAHGEKLLDRNIRRYLGLRDNRVNSGIYETLEDQSGRANFYFASSAEPVGEPIRLG